MKECACTVYGHVQGVAYRVFVRQVAEQLGVVGTVANMPDGSVAVVGQGSEDVLQAFMVFLKQGPPRADVEKVEVTWQTPTKTYTDFLITHHE